MNGYTACNGTGIAILLRVWRGAMMNYFIATTTWSALSRMIRVKSSGLLFRMAGLQAYPLTIFVAGINGRVFPAR